MRIYRVIAYPKICITDNLYVWKIEAEGIGDALRIAKENLIDQGRCPKNYYIDITRLS